MKPNSLFKLAALASALGGAATAPAATITSEMIVHLPFDGNYANVAPGASVVANTAGSPTIDAGRIGSGAVHVSHAQDGSFFNYITLGNPTELNFGGSTDFTVSAWIKVNSKTGDPSIISNKDWRAGGNTGWVIFVGTGGNLGWNYTESSAGRIDSGGSAINDGVWHHIAVSFDRDGNALTFVDGVLTTVTPIGPASETLDSSLPTNIGQDGTGTYTDNSSVSIDALIDDLAIWRRAVSAFEIRRIYEFGTNGVKVSDIPDSPVASLDFTIPANGATDVRADTVVSAQIVDGTAPLNADTVQLAVNGGTVAPSITKLGTVTTVSFQPPTPFENGSTNSALLTFNNGQSVVSTQWSFVVVKAAQVRGITAHWDFDTGGLDATIGQALEFLGGPSGLTAAGTRFGSTESFSIPGIQGHTARVMATKRATNSAIGYVMKHGATPNGDPAATKVNQWTMIMDILIPTEGWHSFIQIDNSGDGDLFVNESNGIGISGQYHGSITRGQWHRVAFAVDMTQGVISKFIDGVKVNDQTAGALNGRWALLPTAVLFADEDGESQAVYVNSIQIRNYKMSDAGVASLGGPTADGVPLVSGQWDFDVNDLTATIGTDLVARGDTGFVTLFEPATIEAAAANVMRFSYPGNAQERVPLGYELNHGILPNAGGEKVNQYTLIMDVMFPSSSTGFKALLQTEETVHPDGEIFLNGANGLGISSQYQGNVTPDVFHRVVITVDLTKRELGKYVDGTNVLSGPVGSTPLGSGPFQYLSATDGILDKRWALDPTALLFADEDGETAAGFVNSIQTRPVVLTAAQISYLGKPTAAGIPVVIPLPPALNIRVGSFGMEIYWPADVTGYILESSETLGPGATWTEIVTSDNLFEESRIPTPGLFYRLRKVQ